MEVDLIINISKEALLTAVKISMPILITSLVIGVIVSILQVATQMQEMTLSFIPKILGVFFSLVFFMPYIYKKFFIFVDHVVQVMVGA